MIEERRKDRSELADAIMRIDAIVSLRTFSDLPLPPMQLVVPAAWGNYSL